MNEESRRKEAEREGGSSNAKLIRQASADAVFLRRISQKGSTGKEGDEKSAYCYVRCRTVSHEEEYATHRQKYLVMYSPFRENQSEKQTSTTNKWLCRFNNWKEKKHQFSYSKEKKKRPSSTSSRACPLAQSVLCLFYRKSSSVTPVSSSPSPAP